MTGRDPAKPVRTTKPGDPPIDLNAELERGHGIITGLEEERDKAKADLAAVRKAFAERTDELDQAARVLTGVAEERDKAVADLAKARKDNDGLVIKVGGLTENLAASDRALAALRDELTEAAEARETAEQENEDLTRRLTEAQTARDNAQERLKLARQAFIDDGYFTPDQVGDDIAPRIVERLAAARHDVTEVEAARNKALEQAAGLRTAQARFAAALRDDHAHAQRQLRSAAAELASKRYRGKALVARHAEAKGRADALAQAEARLP